MTSPARVPASFPRFRVLSGRRPRSRPFTPWIGFSLVLVVAFIGIVVSRTALDRGAFELAELETKIALAESEHERLRLEIARLENPSRINPLAAEAGFVYPEQRYTLLIPGVVGVKNPDPTINTDGVSSDPEPGLVSPEVGDPAGGLSTTETPASTTGSEPSEPSDPNSPLNSLEESVP